MSDGAVSNNPTSRQLSAKMRRVLISVLSTIVPFRRALRRSVLVAVCGFAAPGLFRGGRGAFLDRVRCERRLFRCLVGSGSSCVDGPPEKRFMATTRSSTRDSVAKLVHVPARYRSSAIVRQVNRADERA